MKRDRVLDKAKALVTKDRADKHGNLENNFATIAGYWSIHLGIEVTPADVGIMMNLLKVARIKSNRKAKDNYLDSVGYMACAAEVEGKLKK